MTVGRFDLGVRTIDAFRRGARQDLLDTTKSTAGEPDVPAREADLEMRMPDHLAWSLLRVVHILSGASWAGAAILIATYLMPAIRSAGPGGTAVLRELTAARRLPYVLLGVGLLALVSGAVLLWVDSGGLSRDWLMRPRGLAYSIGAITALAAATIGIAFNIPSANRIGRISSAASQRGAPLTADEADLLARLRERVARGTRAVAWLAGFTTAAMAIARDLA